MLQTYFWRMDLLFLGHVIPAGNCMFKGNNRNTTTRCEICSKLAIKTPEWRRGSEGGGCYHGEHNFYLFQSAIVGQFFASYYLQNEEITLWAGVLF